MSRIIGNYVLDNKAEKELVEKIVLCLKQEKDITIAGAEHILDSVKKRLGEIPMRSLLLRKTDDLRCSDTDSVIQCNFFDDLVVTRIDDKKFYAVVNTILVDLQKEKELTIAEAECILEAALVSLRDMVLH